MFWKIALREKFGGQGSGNYGHQGRPGEVGGSGEGGGGEKVPRFSDYGQVEQWQKNNLKDPGYIAMRSAVARWQSYGWGLSDEMRNDPVLLEAYDQAPNIDRVLFRGEASTDAFGKGENIVFPLSGFSSDRVVAESGGNIDEEQRINTIFETVGKTKALSIENYSNGALRWSEREHIVAGNFRVVKVSRVSGKRIVKIEQI